MRTIKIDNIPLDAEENARHRAAYNAALSAMIPKGEPDSFRHSYYTGHAFAFAEATVREYRRIVAASYPEPKVGDRYRLIDTERIVQIWIDRRDMMTPAQNEVVQKLRTLGNPALRTDEIQTQTQTTRSVIDFMIQVGVLIPAEVGG